MTQKGGPNMYNDVQIRFTRDNAGNYDPLSNHYAPPLFASTFKYAQEARFCLGVAKVRLPDGTAKGVRSKVFDYTMKKIVSISEWNTRVENEFNRVKATKTSTSPWVSNIRPTKGNDPRLWDEDELGRIPKVGGKTIDRLKKVKITRVKHLKNLTSEQLNTIVSAGLS